MIDKSTFIKTLLEKAKKLPVGHYLDIRTYKRNRSVLFIRTAEDNYHLIENGYEQLEFDVDYRGIRQVFKKILKREFPRSNKIRVYTMGVYVEGEAQNVGWKKL